MVARSTARRDRGVGVAASGTPTAGAAASGLPSTTRPPSRTRRVVPCPMNGTIIGKCRPRTRSVSSTAACTTLSTAIAALTTSLRACARTDSCTPQAYRTALTGATSGPT
jgi:hypothetical protein